MGRPYQAELAAFPETYRWALALDLSDYTAAVQRAAREPLVAVGSGGSLSAAQFCADWHQRATGRLARTLTPLEAVATSLGRGGGAAAIFSAGGRNADIRRAFAALLSSEPTATWVVTGAPASPLASAARASSLAPAVVAHSPSAGRDGFLATNSLLGFVLQTHRAYSAAFPGVDRTASALPDAWNEFAGNGPDLRGLTAGALGEATTLIVLHGYTTRAAAVDLESKCTEAGLLHVQLADFRNFAHGRHHWLAKHSDTTVLALVAPEDAALADRTLHLLPRTIPQAQLRIPDRGFRGGLRALVDVMQLTGAIGRAKGIDPGRPGVPDYGGKLYSLKGIDMVEGPETSYGTVVRGRTRPEHGVTAAQQAIARKIGRPASAAGDDERAAWMSAYNDARAHLASQRFVGVVFDYDGTLVDAADRFTGPRPEVTRALCALLADGATLGVATGRGQSAGKELRATLPSSMWDRVLMGYYNGSDIAFLRSEDAPDRHPDVSATLARILEALEASTTLRRHAAITPRRCQITVEPHRAAPSDDVWAATEGIVLRVGGGARVVRSSHSIDVLAPGVSKVSLVDAVRTHVQAPGHAPVLRIGDRARWPGNDGELLASLDGVSVDEVSADPVSAWNFAAPGVRGVAATRGILELLSVQDGVVRLAWTTDAARNTARARGTA
jgi:fructoselysine-6-P-deglycase FrlB-like protein